MTVGFLFIFVNFILNAHTAVLDQVSHSVLSDSLCPHRLCCPQRFSLHGILQERIMDWAIFPTQGLNLGTSHCRRILHCLSHQRRPGFLLFFFSFIFISWRLITSQHCSGFCHTLTWISHGVTCIPHPNPPSRPWTSQYVMVNRVLFALPLLWFPCLCSREILWCALWILVDSHRLFLHIKWMLI